MEKTLKILSAVSKILDFVIRWASDLSVLILISGIFVQVFPIEVYGIALLIIVPGYANSRLNDFIAFLERMKLGYQEKNAQIFIDSHNVQVKTVPGYAAFANGLLLPAEDENKAKALANVLGGEVVETNLTVFEL